MAVPHISVIQADITCLSVDAIVNAANKELAGGGGVDGAIHAAAGPELMAFCQRLGGCPTGEARCTPGFRLPARFVIHAVGPVWQGGTHNEDALLASAYRNALQLAHAAGARTVAFAAISTGVYGFPADRAAAIAIKTLCVELATLPDLKIMLIAFSKSAAQILSSELQKHSISGTFS